MKQHLFSVTAADCEWQYFKGPGNGGQKKQKTSSAVRVTHKPSGAVGQCSENRSQLQNKQEAFKKMANSIEMRKWLNKRINEIRDGQKAEEWVDDQTKPENLKIEIKEGGKWTETKTME